MQVIGWTQVFQAAQFVLSGALRGAGDTKFSLKITFIGVWGIRIVLTLIFVYIFDWGLLGAWLAIAVDQVYRTLFLILRFRRGDWKTIKV
jgi:Na+-driven multidrug efflux pump